MYHLIKVSTGVIKKDRDIDMEDSKLSQLERWISTSDGGRGDFGPTGTLNEIGCLIPVSL